MPGDDRWWGRPLAETRWQLELGRLMVDPVLRGRDVPRGDGRPVVLMPGFGAGDQTLLVLAAWLRRMGYRARVEPPTAGAFVEIFKRTAAARGIPVAPECLNHILKKYAAEKRVMKGCEPRDLLNKINDLCADTDGFKTQDCSHSQADYDKLSDNDKKLADSIVPCVMDSEACSTAFECLDLQK